MSRAKRGFGHPFPGGWIPNRLDMGYDGTFTGHIYTPFAATVVYAGLFNGWNGSHGVIIRANRDVGLPNGQRCLYFVEGCHELVHSGQKVKLGDQIAKAVDSPYGDSYGHGAKGAIEFGVAEDGPVGAQTNAYAIALGTGSSAARAMVLAFNEWCQAKLGMTGATDTSSAGAP